MSLILDKYELDQLIRAAFLDEGSSKIIAEDGEITGAIGDDYEFRAFKVKGFTTVYQIDLSIMGDENKKTVESFILHKHSDRIPNGSPRRMEVYRLVEPLPTTRSARTQIPSGQISPRDGMELELVI